MDKKAYDIGTLLEVIDTIYHQYYIDEESLDVRVVLRTIMEDIQIAIDNIMDDMHDKVGLDD